MCQVGVRCYADSNKKLKSEMAKLKEVDEQIKIVQESFTVAARNNDYNAYAEARGNLERLHDHRNRIVFERNSAQRDVDGTKHGRTVLEEMMMNADSLEEFDELRSRKNQGEATAFARSYSANMKKEGRPPVIFLPGDKKPKAKSRDM